MFNFEFDEKQRIRASIPNIVEDFDMVLLTDRHHSPTLLFVVDDHIIIMPEDSTKEQEWITQDINSIGTGHTFLRIHQMSQTEPNQVVPGSTFTIPLCDYRAAREPDSPYGEAMRYLIQLAVDNAGREFLRFTVVSKTMYELQSNEKLTPQQKNTIVDQKIAAGDIKDLGCFGAICKFGYLLANHLTYRIMPDSDQEERDFALEFCPYCRKNMI